MSEFQFVLGFVSQYRDDVRVLKFQLELEVNAPLEASLLLVHYHVKTRREKVGNTRNSRLNLLSVRG